MFGKKYDGEDRLLPLNIALVVHLALGSVPSHASNLNCEKISSILNQKRSTIAVYKFRKTRNEFIVELEAAIKYDRGNVPSLFAGRVQGLEFREKVYRIDKREPTLIVLDNGFWPNPNKLKGTLLEHTVETDGTGSYVSFTTEEIPDAIVRGGSFLREPNFVIVNGRERRTTTDEWAGWFNTPLKRYREYPTEAVWYLYQYAVSALEGVPIYGGEFSSESEFIALGAPLNRIKYSRVITVRAPIEKYDNQRTSEIELTNPLLPTRYYKERLSVSYGEWVPVL